MFHGPASLHRAEAAYAGGHAGDGAPPMRWAAGALALALVAAGLGGPALEHLLHHAFVVGGFHEALLLDGPLRLVAAGFGRARPRPRAVGPGRRGRRRRRPGWCTAGAWPRLGRCSIAAGRPGGLHRLFRSRWGIDAALTRVFVDGTRRIAQRVAGSWEAGLDEAVHRRWPVRLTERMQDLVHRLRADTEELLYNVSYVLILFGLLLAYMFLGAG